MSLMDCNSIWTAIAARYELEKRPFAEAPYIIYVTAGFPDNPKLLKPIPIDIDHISIVSKVLELNEKSRKCLLSSIIYVKGVICAETQVLAVQPELTQKEIRKYLGITK